MALLAATGCGSETATVERFAYVAELETQDTPSIIAIRQSGIVIGLEREYSHLELTVDGFSMNSETVRIGDSRWVRDDYPFIEVGFGPTLYIDGVDGSAAREALADALLDVTGIPETINGIAARRYELSGAQLANTIRAVARVPSGIQPTAGTLWVAESLGVPVKLLMERAAIGEPGSVRLEINVTNLNDPTLAVAIPTSTASTQLSNHLRFASLSRHAYQDASAWDRFKAGLGAAIGFVTGVDPFSMSEAVDDVVDNLEGLEEIKENAEEYFDAYPDAPGRDRYTLADEDLSDKTWVYTWFWGLFE